jgi:membrane-associated protein
MHEAWEFLKQLVNPESIIYYGGLYLVLFVIFAETGLFFGFFLPGDSLLFTAGLFCATGNLNVNFYVLLVLIIAAAVLGNWVGYMFGRKVGVVLYKRKSTWIFKQAHLQMGKDFYEKNGGVTIIFSRFLPIFRTFAPIVAGIVKQEFHLFMTYNLLGAVIWVGTLTSIGYVLGKVMPGIGLYLEYIIIGLIVITTIPIIYKVIRSKSK